MADIAELVRQSQISRPSKVCWRTRLEGEADEYMAIIDSMDYPNEVRGASVRRILQETFDIPALSDEKVRNHLRGGCTCPIRRPLKT